jgi:hypothetical protein
MSLVNHYHHKYLTRGRKKFPKRRDEHGRLIIPKGRVKNQDFVDRMSKPTTVRKTYKQYLLDEERKDRVKQERVLNHRDAPLKNADKFNQMATPTQIRKIYPGEDAIAEMSMAKGGSQYKPLKASLAAKCEQMSKPLHTRTIYEEPDTRIKGYKQTSDFAPLKKSIQTWVESASKPSKTAPVRPEYSTSKNLGGSWR